MQVELIETASEVRLRTPELELGWSRESGALVMLARPGAPSLLGHGPPRAGLDVALGAPDGWTAHRSFARYLSHRCAERDGAVEVAVSVGLGPLKVRDRYVVRGAAVERTAELENVGPDELRLFGLRLVLPDARVGDAQSCRLDAPGNSVRPRVPLAVAAAQRRDVLPRRFFAPGVRGGGALEPAPAQGPGLLALHGGPPAQTLLCWFEAADAAALPYLEGADGSPDAVSLAHELGLAGWLRSGERLAAGVQRLLLVDEPWERARERYRAALPPAAPRAAWAAEAPIYLCSPADFGGLAGLAAALPALAELGVGALALRPLHLAADGQILDLERIDPALGDEAALVALVEVAHAAGLRVLLDLELRGCAADSRYLLERPEWFARNADGGLAIGPSAGAPAASAHPGVAARPGCYSFDWQSEELQAYLLDWAAAQAETYGLDGFRAIAPYSPALSWQRRPPLHAAAGALAPLAWLARLRDRLAGRRPDLAILSTIAGPAAAAVCDGVYDYLAHLMFVHAALSRVTGHELGTYLDDLLAVAPPGVARIGFVESHDTCVQNPLADGLRGSRISRMLQAGLALCGFVPSLWSGQERGEEPFLRALLGLWRAEPALRRGAADFAAASCPSPQVLTVLREHDGRRLLGLMHTGPCPAEVRVALPFEPPRDSPRDLLGLAPIAGGPAADGLRLTLAPFSAYCLEL